jgi:RHH-type proline utilization regulon transcriptional repressor/proline dehydrogenase/delta 1-pyrroline-5-carboxylate dehydrogenase
MATIGLEVDAALRRRLAAAAEAQGATTEEFLRKAVVTALNRLDGHEAATADVPSQGKTKPFRVFASVVQPQTMLRAKITEAYRAAEELAVPPLLEAASLPEPAAREARQVARRLAEAVRAKSSRRGVEALIQEYTLSTQEGVALMCLAEALLRIPDQPTRDALIRDKIGGGDWRSHRGHSPSMFVNAATWGLLLTGRLTSPSGEAGLSAALGRLARRGGEPLIRAAADTAMRMLGEHFVSGQTIAEALANSRHAEARGFRHSFDMLGEAAMTAHDADHHYSAYEEAILAIGRSGGGRGVYEGPGISIKLSALHPRYSRAQRERVMTELLQRLRTLARRASGYAIGLNIDAEEADRLELSLDLLEALCFDPTLAGWDGLGFVVQAYQKRAPSVVDFLIDLARRSGRRLMVRLVKGAYWDTEIKRAQVDGLEGFPVYTRKAHTDLCYIACARKLLAAPSAVFPQFATHNAQTLATIHALAGPAFHVGQYEFQCLQGMGEPLYEEVIGGGKLDRPCRIYAPVGTHDTLLAYLVRRLLENGANTSFVNRIGDPDVSIEALIADPVEQVRNSRPAGAPHPAIPLPRDLFGSERPNSAGLDLSNEQRLASLSATLLAEAERPVHAAPLLVGKTNAASGPAREVRNPADQRDLIGHVVDATPDQVAAALAHAVAAAPAWAATPPALRAACLMRAADLMEERMGALLGLIVREAGKSFPNAIAEVREAVDFLRYYASQARAHFGNQTHRPLGPVASISPWNFPLAIFTGQAAAALAAGNPVLAKPAEETPLIAMRAVEILREAGVPPGVVQLLPGDGEIGAALVADPRVCGVVFTGSNAAAKSIQRELATRLGPDGKPVPLIAETGGQNALIVDSSALPEQVVGDVLASAFDSAGQRCSALRLLCLQDDIADRVLGMLQGAMAELTVGNPDRLSIDVGPVISADAQRGIEAHVSRMHGEGRPVHARPLPAECGLGSFVAPTLIEIERVAELTGEVFGPVLHVVRYRRDDLDRLIAAINATGYALTFGVHSRIEETVTYVTERIEAGNIYVNRNLIGAVVGVQPFGGHGLSGTGPKAGGPLYLLRLLASHPGGVCTGEPPAAARLWEQWLRASGRSDEAEWMARCIAETPFGYASELPGPAGERNTYTLGGRGAVLCLAASEAGVLRQIGAALATGNRALVASASATAASVLSELPPALRDWVGRTAAPAPAGCEVVLFEGSRDALLELAGALAELPGPIVPVHLTDGCPLERLVRERSVSNNTTAAGGNASLMVIG